MQLRHFVCGSAVVLVGWLAVTFVYKVPSQRYPKLDKYPTASLPKGNSAPAARVGSPAPEVARVSDSH